MRYVIIGNGPAGHAAAKSIRGRDPAGRILVITDAVNQAYHRPLIPALIEGVMSKESLYREDLPAPEGVEVRLGVRVKAVDSKAKRLSLENKESVSYDRLLLATGSSAIRLPTAGLEGPNVHVLRTIRDAEAIKVSAEKAKRAVVIGGGRVGMKAAFALNNLGMEVSVVERLTRVVPLQFDDTAAEIIKGAVDSHGIRLFLGRTVREVERGDPGVRAVVLDDGGRLETDLVILAVGVQPNADLARAAGLKINQGVLVNEYLQTSDPAIFAAGDLVETADVVTGENIVSGLWTNAVEMGRTAGVNMTGGKALYTGAFSVLNSFELANIPTISVGLIDPPEQEGYEVHSCRRGDSYRKLVFRQGVLMGAILVGEIEGAGVYTGLIKRKTNVGRHLETLLAPRPSYAPWLRRERESL
ncbi:MAG: NAD(P)/FAD-dependent oxidoreductase [Syntrophobacteria bacterium]